MIKGETQMRALLCFVADVLRPGGYFFGTTTASGAIWTLAQKEITHRESQKRRGHPLSKDVRVKMKLFELRLPGGDNLQPIGTEYLIRYRSVAPSTQPEAEFLVHFPTLVEQAKDVGLRMLSITNFRDFWEDHRKTSNDLLRALLSAEFTHGDPPLLASQDIDLISLFCTFIFIKD